MPRDTSRGPERKKPSAARSAADPAAKSAALRPLPLRDEVAAEEGRQDRSEGIERLRKRQPGRGGFRAPKDRDVGIRGHLKNRDARREGEESTQEQPVRANGGSRIEKQTARGRDEQADDDAALITDLPDDDARGEGDTTKYAAKKQT